MVVENFRFTARKDVIASDIGGDLALLDLDTSMYFTLNPTGAEIWKAMESPKSIKDLVTAVTSTFDVDESQCLQDVETVVADLVEAKLVQRTVVPG